MPKKILLSLLFCAIFAMSQPNDFTSRLVAVQGKHVFFANPEGIYYGLDWRRLPDMPGVVHESWLQADLSQDISAIDEQGNLWLILPPQLVCYNQIRDNWRVWVLPPQLQVELHSIEYWQGKPWISTKDSLWCFHVEQQWWQSLDYPKIAAVGRLPSDPDTPTRLLKKFSPQQLWLDGTAYFDGKRWFVLPSPPIPLTFWPKTAECFTWDAQGFPWIATVHGIYYYDPKARCWRIAPGKTFERAYSIIYYQKKIWATDYGNGVYEFYDNDWHEIAPHVKLPHLAYTYSLRAADNVLWFDTYFGIGSFDGQHWQAHYDDPIYQQQSYFTVQLVAVMVLLGAVMIIILWPSRRYWSRRWFLN